MQIAWQNADQTIRINIEDSVVAMVAQLEAAGVTVTDFNKGEY